MTGASGLIGSALVPHLRAQGHEVVRLVRRRSGAPDEVTWDPDGRHGRPGRAGGRRRRRSTSPGPASATTAGPTTTRRDPGLPRPGHAPPSPRAGLAGPPPGSARLRLGDRLLRRHRGRRAVDETAPAGTGFLADVVVAWEAAAQPARERRHPRRAPPHGVGRGRARWGLGQALADLPAGRRGQARLGSAVVVVHLAARRAPRPDLPARPPPRGPGQPDRPQPGDQRRDDQGHGRSCCIGRRCCRCRRRR